MKRCINNNWIKDSISIAIQVTFIFAFLTIFFFVYVHEVEKEEFRTQINIIIDNIVNDFESDLAKIMAKQTISKENATAVMNGIIDIIQEKTIIESRELLDEITERNSVVKKNALKTMIGVMGAVIITAIMLILLGFCIPIIYQVKEAMLIVVFVGITEFLFLETIAKNYITASPSKVRKALANTIEKWLKNNS